MDSTTRTKSVEVSLPRRGSQSSFTSKSNRHALDVVVDNVSYEVTNVKTKDRLKLLTDVSCVFEHGRVHALMGASGAGKTTLLDVITSRVTSGEVSGNGVYYGGTPATKESFRACAAYVEQRDTLLASLTVKEMLNYWAELRARNEDERVEILARVPGIIDDLNLGECADVVVGDSLSRGISGGQAKRTNLALALITDPDVLFLDEPTSGLDSATSLDIVQILKQLADSGVTVIATIHSPTSEAFRLFDSLVMLKKGRVAFAGPMNTVTTYFHGLGYEYTESFNMADFYVGAVASDDVDCVGAFAKSSAGDANKGAVTAARAKEQLPPPPQPKVTRGALSKIVTLIKYRTRYNYKNPDFVAARSAGNILFGFVMMSLFWKIGAPSGDAQEQSTQLNVASLLSMINILPSFQASGYMPSVVMERAMFYREIDDGVYPLLSYIAYKIIEEGLLAIPVSLVAQMMLFLGCAIKGNFFYFWIINYGVMSCGIALAYVCSAVAPDIDSANTLLPVYNVVQLLFSGLIIRPESMPKGWAWYRHTLFVRYGWQAQMRNHFHNGEPKVFVDDSGTAVGVSDFYGVKHSLSTNILAVFGIWLFWIVLAYVAMKNIRHQKR